MTGSVADAPTADRATGPLPPGLPGLDRRYSHELTAAGERWHYLDNAPDLRSHGLEPVGTVLAVHGNPTWSYLWRGLLAAGADARWRVVAVDQLEMGLSARTGRRRRLADRVADLGAFTDALGLEGPVVTLGHDWGGVVSLGWAVDHPEALAGVVLLNTAVHQPDDAPVPPPLRLALARLLRRPATRSTRAFLEATLALAHPRLPHDVADVYRLPYRTAADRDGIEGFVADIPADPAHPSAAELARIAAGVAKLEVPALLLWGARDPVFSDRYLDDLLGRLPHARAHRYEAAGHLLAEDVDWPPAVTGWLEREVASAIRDDRATSAEEGAGTKAPFAPIWAGLDARADDDEAAVLDLSGRGPRTVTWRALDRQVRRIAAGLHEIGVRPGDRVSLLVEPGPTLTATVYACLRIGAVVVVADAGLGVRGLTRAQLSAWPRFVIAQPKALAAARALGWPGVRISADRLPAAARRALGVAHDLADVARAGDGLPLPSEPGPDDEAAVLFTSGSTGPAKGVVYTHGSLAALRDALAAHFGIGPDTGLVTGFAPFALLGPALGTRSVTPRMDVSAPRTLTARAVADAVRAADAGMVFLSPAAVRNVVATADALDDPVSAGGGDRAALARVRTFLSTGAPISADLLRSAAKLMPAATAHTPYGMTECLLVTDVTLDGLGEVAEAADDGVCVGRPVAGSEVLISALDEDGAATGVPAATPGVLGEVLVRAAHLKERYDRLWLTDLAAERATPPGHWHRTGDVGHLDAEGRLWIEGRVVHVLTTADGPIAPVGPEQHVERVPQVGRAALVGVGPAGVQQPVVVVEPAVASGVRRPGLAPFELTAAVRAVCPVPLAAVLVVPEMPTDVRHNSKIDRSRLAAWAGGVLAGGRVGAP